MIKTPQQLIIVVVLSFIVPVLVIVMLAQLAVDGHKNKPADTAAAEEAIAKRIKPAGDVVIAAAGAANEVREGKVVYEAACAACHTTGVLNSPKLGDKQAWAARIAQGQEKLIANAMKGIRQMPARGGNPDLSDIELARAVIYLANEAGSSWKEPAAPAAASPAATSTAVAAAPTAAMAAPAAGGDAAKGKSIYDTSCAACHAVGVAGAPKAGDKAAWAPRLKSGNDALYASSLKGKGAMPPKGGNAGLSDADVKAAVDYLTGLVK